MLAFNNFSKKKVKTDLVLYFPNNYLANTEWVVEGENTDNLEFDDHGKIKTDYNQRTDHKRIFAAGDCTSSLFFTDGSRVFLFNIVPLITHFFSSLA